MTKVGKFANIMRRRSDGISGTASILEFKEDAFMTMTKAKKRLDIVRGSGNVFADFGHPNAAAEQIKAHLAAEIIRILDTREMTARQAEAMTGIVASDFSRIRNVKLDRFTIDRLVTVLEGLDQVIRFRVTAKPHGRTVVSAAP